MLHQKTLLGVAPARRLAQKIFELSDALKKHPALLYGFLLIVGALSVRSYVLPYHFIDPNIPIEQIYMGSRINALNACLQPVLAGEIPPLWDLTEHNTSLFLYAAYLGKLLGKTSAEQVYLTIQSYAAALLYLVYPLVVYRMTRSLLISCAAPWLVDHFVGAILIRLKGDCYYGLAWIVVIAVPLLAVFWQRRDGTEKWTFFAATCLAMGLGNVPRMHASLPILLILLGMLLIQQVIVPLRAKRLTPMRVCSTGLLMAAAIIAYLLFASLIPRLFLAAVGHAGTYSNVGPWHAIYVGVGWEENPWGITFWDSCAYYAVMAKDPTAENLGPEYMRILKELWLGYWRENPRYMLGNYFRKFLACCADDWRYCTGEWLQFPRIDGRLWLLSFAHGFVFSGWALGSRKSSYRDFAPAILCALLCVFLCMDFPMMATPSRWYGLGSQAACGTLFVLAAMALLQQMQNALRKYVYTLTEREK